MSANVGIMVTRDLDYNSKYRTLSRDCEGESAWSESSSEEYAIGKLIMAACVKHEVEPNPGVNEKKWYYPVHIWEEFDGFSNEITWLIMEWINNCQPVHDALMYELMNAVTWEPKDLRDWIVRRLPPEGNVLRFTYRELQRRGEVVPPGIFKLIYNLMRCSLDLVDWNELAGHLVDQVKEARKNGETFGPPYQRDELCSRPDDAGSRESGHPADWPGETKREDVPHQPS